MIAADDTRPRVVRLDEHEWVFECPGCHCSHAVNEGWSFNGDVVRPTFLPSILVCGVVNAEDDPTPTRCHSYVADGQIQFLADSTHKLARQTVDLEPWQ